MTGAAIAGLTMVRIRSEPFAEPSLRSRRSREHEAENNQEATAFRPLVEGSAREQDGERVEQFSGFLSSNTTVAKCCGERRDDGGEKPCGGK